MYCRCSCRKVTTESNVLDLSVFNWMQTFIDSMEPVTRDDIKAAVMKAWEEMPESVILNSFEHLKQVHEGIVERNGGNRLNKGA